MRKPPFLPDPECPFNAYHATRLPLARSASLLVLVGSRVKKAVFLLVRCSGNLLKLFSVPLQLAVIIHNSNMKETINTSLY